MGTPERNRPRRGAGSGRARRGGPSPEKGRGARADRAKGQPGARRSGRGRDAGQDAAGNDRGRGRPGASDGERQRGRRAAEPGKGRGADAAGRRRTGPVGGERRDWGSVARRGAEVLGEDPTGASARRDRDGGAARPRPRDEWHPEVWVEEPAAAGKKPAKGRAGRPRRPKALPDDVRAELASAVGRRASALEPKLAEAVRAYEADRYQEARRILRPLAEAAPDVGAVRELLGLTLYRMGRWQGAIRELEAFHVLTGSFDQHPVLADAHRALRHWDAVDRLWEELRRASPGADVVAEGRIVAAGARADRGDVTGAIRLLEQAPVRSSRPHPHHLRLWYATADLYERAGDLPRARRLFGAILRHDPEFVDVAERLAALG